MSGSGGFYRYHCKYFYSYNCQEWVYQNGAACAKCLADGRDFGETEIVSVVSPWKYTREIYVPRVQDGILQYCLMDLVLSSDIDSSWTLRAKVKPTQAPSLPIMVTNAIPGPTMATSGAVAERY